ncbi:MAG TPA: hypothetical protein VK793_02175 [Steroidobacteraceae bacterium]|nr:hypothetical protein [Steroidobacteraceae bacterium]
MDVLPVVAVAVLVEAAAPVAEVGVDVAPVLADGVAAVAVEAPAAVEVPAVAVAPAEELVAAAGVLAA